MVRGRNERPAENNEERLYEQAATLDVFAERYHWTEDQVLSTRQVMLDRLPIIWRMQREAAETKKQSALVAGLVQQIQSRR